MKPLKHKIRRASSDDLEDIYSIEIESFASPWSYSSFTMELQNPFSLFLVAEGRSGVIAFAVAWKVTDEIHLNNIAVRGNCRNRGVGHSLVKRIISLLHQQGAVKVYLEVREKNLAARGFYRKMGFIESGFRKNYYQDDHAILMEKELREF